MTTITGHHKKHCSTTVLLEKHVLSINIEPLTSSELQEIIKTLYPSLTTVSSRMVNVFLIKDAEMPKTSRLTSTRDLFKWCERAIVDFDVSKSGGKILRDAIDVFCSSYSDLKDRLYLGTKIASILGERDDAAVYYCSKYKPLNRLTEDGSIGRGRLSAVQTMRLKNMKFCFTRPSLCLLEKILCCIMHKEPVLLVGETGTGKTTSIQYLAHLIGQKLIVINMNQQSDSADLLGGFKPVDLKFVVAPIKKEFEEVFRSYYNVEKNRKFLNNISICFNSQRWDTLLKLMQKSHEAALVHLESEVSKKSIVEENKRKCMLELWKEVGKKLQKLELQLKYKNSLAFSFIEGSLVKAIENGYWVLLDEINLANAETLECLSGLLEGSKGSLNLIERGDKKPIKRHPQFTLFACMNPSTDVGKRDLPVGLRNRFTEFFVDELTEKMDLLHLGNSYLPSIAPDRLEMIINFYIDVRKKATLTLSDGLGHKPHFSLRSLCRALTIAAKSPNDRNLYEAFSLAFLTQLDSNSYILVEKMITK